MDKLNGIHCMIATFAFVAYTLRINIIGILVICAILVGVHKVLKDMFVEASANEWLIVTRDGKLLQSTIGGSRFMMPGDRHITFPSILRKVTFSAEQISKEMQGVQVTGTIVWTVHTKGAGAYQCY
jgi:hypothetical protein